MSKRKQQLRHGNKMMPSTVDTIMLGNAVEDRFLDVCDLFQRLRGLPLVPPESLNRDMILWRQMRVRHRCKKCGSKFILQDVESRLPILAEDNLPVCGICGQRGDYQNTESELRATKAIAEWTHEMNRQLRNQEEDTQNKHIEWREE